MAKQRKNIIMMGASGKLGNVLIIKQYKGFQVYSKYPDMSKVRVTGKQAAHRIKFGALSKQAKAISKDPIESAPYREQLKEGDDLHKLILTILWEKSKEQ
jgi:hypothetical protein